MNTRKGTNTHQWSKVASYPDLTNVGTIVDSRKKIIYSQKKIPHLQGRLHDQFLLIRGAVFVF